MCQNTTSKKREADKENYISYSPSFVSEQPQLWKVLVGGWEHSFPLVADVLNSLLSQDVFLSSLNPISYRKPSLLSRVERFRNISPSILVDDGGVGVSQRPEALIFV